jgi:undecaprenyl-diphosphatase
MNILQAMILGLVQGLTEFLPVSSSAHIRIVGELIGTGSDPGAAFTAILQIGTETAVLFYFRRDIARIARAWWEAIRGAHGTDRAARLGEGDVDARMAWWIIIGTVPIVLLGLVFQHSIEHNFRDLRLIVLMLAGFALVLGWADRVGRQDRGLDDINRKHAVLFGLAQALALIPGVSRSGGTISAGLLLGYTREAAARYSFLLAIPAVLGSGLFELAKSAGEFGKHGHPGLGVTIVATLIAFVVGYVAIIAFLKIVTTYSYRPFVRYRLGLSAVVLLLLVFHVLSPLGTTTG